MNLSDQIIKEYSTCSHMETKSPKSDDKDIIYKIIPVSTGPTHLQDHRAFTNTSSYTTSSEEDIHHSGYEERIPSPSFHTMSDSASASTTQNSWSFEVTNISSALKGQLLSQQQISKNSKVSKDSLLNKTLKELHPKSLRSCNLLPSCVYSACMPNTSIPRPSKLVMLASLFLVILSLQPELSAARSVGVCRGIPCANGGRLLVSNSIWGNCRCRCPSGFVGPYCQYRAAYKRSGNSASSQQSSVQETGTRVGRSETMELIRQHLLALAQMQLPSSSSDTSSQDESQGDDSEEIIIDNISRRDADFALQALSKLANLPLIEALDGSETLEIHRKPQRQHRVWRAKRSGLRTPWYRR